MMLKRPVLAAVLCVCALGGAVATAALAAGTPDERPTGPDPALANWPEWPYEVTCGGVAFDPLQAFAGETGAERGSKPSEKALRHFLEEGSLDSVGVARRDWRLVAEGGGEAEFTQGRLGRQLQTMSFEETPEGWRWNGWSGDCDPGPVIDGIGNVVSWSIAEKQGRITPQTRTLWVDLGPGECSGGKPQNQRARFRFLHLGRRLLMIAWLRPLPPGVYTCPGTTEPPRKVRLPAPLGELRLFDGSSFPPKPARTTSALY